MIGPAAILGTDLRAVVSQEGADRTITLTIYTATNSPVAVELSPVRALELARELTALAVTAIKTAQWGPDWPG